MKKVISLILSVVMVFTVFSVALSSSAFAADTATNETIAVTSIDVSGIKIPSSWDELGNMLKKPIGKSTVSHRFKRLKEYL